MSVGAIKTNTATISVPKDLLERAIEALTGYTDGGCDHSVGICWCDIKGIIRDLTEARDRTVPGVCHIEYIAIEHAPLNSHTADPEVDAYITEYDNLPAVFATSLDDVISHIDCSRCGNCKNGVGYVLVEYDDYPERSGLQWRPVWLVREDGSAVGLLCEECSPIVPTS